MNSAQWLEIYGLAARKLGIYDVLGGVAFRHQDGVIDVMSKPSSETQTDAVSTVHYSHNSEFKSRVYTPVNFAHSCNSEEYWVFS